MQKVFSNTFLNKNAINYSIYDIGKVLDNLKSKCKVEKKPTKKRYGLAFCSTRSTMCKDEKEYETVNFESLKGKEKDIQVDISVETPKSKNVKTPSPSERVEDFTAQ